MQLEAEEKSGSFGAGFAERDVPIASGDQISP